MFIIIYIYIYLFIYLLTIMQLIEFVSIIILLNDFLCDIDKFAIVNRPINNYLMGCFINSQGGVE